MFDFIKRKKTQATEQHDTVKEKNNKEGGVFERLRKGLVRTRVGFTSGLATLILGQKTIDDELLCAIEERLITADIGMVAYQQIIKDLKQQVSRKELNDPPALLAALKAELLKIIKPCEQPLVIPELAKPYVILMVGVNGVGKTTTIGKLAKKLQNEGRKVMLAGADTFRAAAIEQLQVWGQRNAIPVIAQQQGSDSASVTYDAYQAAAARGYDVLIVDTAGRLHTHVNLMEELKKIRRILSKLEATAPHEVMLVLDAGTGQNGLQQAKQFYEAIGITGITITKLDGTAKGGIVFAIAKALELPIRFIGIGEAIDDLRSFKADEFVAALFTED